VNKLYIAIAGMAFAALLGAVAQILFKKSNPAFNLSLLTNWWLIVGIALYGIGFIINLLAYRAGDASVLYPVIALSYFFVVVLAAVFLGEPLTTKKVVGSLLIVGGVSLIALK
jgi:drug/metabolite transporter (DMT)-like permease